jgi:hypothetical protein
MRKNNQVSQTYRKERKQENNNSKVEKRLKGNRKERQILRKIM